MGNTYKININIMPRDPDDRLVILYRVARALADRSAGLFEEGAGVPIIADENDPDNILGAIDDVGVESEAFSWMNASLMFMRYVHGILNDIIQRSLEEDMLQILNDEPDSVAEFLDNEF